MGSLALCNKINKSNFLERENTGYSDKISYQKSKFNTETNKESKSYSTTNFESGIDINDSENIISKYSTMSYKLDKHKNNKGREYISKLNLFEITDSDVENYNSKILNYDINKDYKPINQTNINSKTYSKKNQHKSLLYNLIKKSYALNILTNPEDCVQDYSRSEHLYKINDAKIIYAYSNCDNERNLVNHRKTEYKEKIRVYYESNQGLFHVYI